jgi:hypothetical protein
MWGSQCAAASGGLVETSSDSLQCLVLVALTVKFMLTMPSDGDSSILFYLLKLVYINCKKKFHCDISIHK